MENHRRHRSNSSGDNFTFPAMSPDVELESELADHLFSNGKFLLHTFPLQPKTLSRTSSVGSKDSLLSSRSNSTNSRSSSSSSSSCSSARSSTSGTEASTRVAIRSGISPSPVHYSNNYNIPAQRRQFIAPAPVLHRRTSQTRKEGSPSPPRKKSKKCSSKKGYCRRFFRWLVSSCKECHAMEPSKQVF